jgi:hypothetical protein
MTDKLVEYVPRDLLNLGIAAAHQPRVEPWVTALNAKRGPIVDVVIVIFPSSFFIETRRFVRFPFVTVEPTCVVVESPTPLIRSSIEDPGPTAGLINCHGPVIAIAGKHWPGIAAKTWRWGDIQRRNGTCFASGVQLPASTEEGLERVVVRSRFSMLGQLVALQVHIWRHTYWIFLAAERLGLEFNPAFLRAATHSSPSMIPASLSAPGLMALTRIFRSFKRT